MRLVTVDAGNTAIKMGVFEGAELIAHRQFHTAETGTLSAFFRDFPVDAGIALSVRSESTELSTLFSPYVQLHVFDTATPVPVDNQYASKETLGPDRLAAVIGAQQIFPGENSLVIGAGTTLTYDFISADKKYDGGSISPGLFMRFDALHRFTAKLPHVKPDFSFRGDHGDSTRTSILSGVQNGMLHEMEGFIRTYEQTHGRINVIMTGGDAAFFAGLLKKSIFARSVHTEPNLVLIGLNTVYHYNDQTV